MIIANAARGSFSWRIVTCGRTTILGGELFSPSPGTPGEGRGEGSFIDESSDQKRKPSFASNAFYKDVRSEETSSNSDVRKMVKSISCH